MSETNKPNIPPRGDQVENHDLNETAPHQDATFVSCYQMDETVVTLTHTKMIR